MNGITKETYLKASPEVKLELLFDLQLDTHKNITKILENETKDKTEIQVNKSAIKRLRGYIFFALGLVASVLGIK